MKWKVLGQCKHFWSDARRLLLRRSYYRHPPPYFHGWAQDGPPRWGDHWGNDWQRERSGWDQWNRSSAPAPAPLPTYQREYSKDRYPSYEQQRTLQSENYHYQPHDRVVQRHYQQYVAPKAPAPNQQRPPERQQAPPQQHQQQAPPQQRQQQEPQQQHQQQAPQQQPSGQEHGSQGQGKGKSEQPNQGQGQDKEGKDKGGNKAE